MTADGLMFQPLATIADQIGMVIESVKKSTITTNVNTIMVIVAYPTGWTIPFPTVFSWIVI